MLKVKVRDKVSLVGFGRWVGSVGWALRGRRSGVAGVGTMLGGSWGSRSSRGCVSLLGSGSSIVWLVGTRVVGFGGSGRRKVRSHLRCSGKSGESNAGTYLVSGSGGSSFIVYGRWNGRSSGYRCASRSVSIQRCLGGRSAPSLGLFLGRAVFRCSSGSQSWRFPSTTVALTEFRLPSILDKWA